MIALLILIVCGLGFAQGSPQSGYEYTPIRKIGTKDVIIPDPSQCMPIYVEVYPPRVEVKDKNSPKEYFLNLTTVRRCSGYCHDENCICQPDRKEILQVQVPVATFDKKNQKWGKQGLKSVEFENHISCKCDIEKETYEIFSPEQKAKVAKFTKAWSPWLTSIKDAVERNDIEALSRLKGQTKNRKSERKRPWG